MEIQNVRRSQSEEQKRCYNRGEDGAWWDSPMDQISLKTPNPKCPLFLKIDQ